MYSLAIYIGIYSYIVLILGITHLLYSTYVIAVSYAYLAAIFIINYRNINIYFANAKIKNIKLPLIVLLLIIQASINLIGALGPELSFDALWYHLTIPKIYLLNHSLFVIPGNLFYYSGMPKLTELLYIFGLAQNNEIIAKLMHFLFGILTLIVIYKLSRKFLSKTYSIFSCLIFYSNLVVGWESISAMIDLARSFYEVMAFLSFINYLDSKERKWIIMCGVMLGFAISIKILALGSVFIIIFLLILLKYIFGKKIIFLKNTFYVLIFSILIPLPYFLISFLSTNNPFYPFFSNIYPYKINISFFNLLNFVKDLWNIFLYSPDPISPVYIISFPLLIIFYKKLKYKEKIILAYSFASLIIWYVTPRTGGGRFLMPYLPVLSVLVMVIINKIKIKNIKNFILICIIFTSIISIFYRGIANLKYMPVILGYESKDKFLTNNLNFKFGDFYDIDNYFKKNIKKNDKVLIYGGHNLFYVNFPFIHETYVKKGDEFNYVLTIRHELPKRFWYWKLVYKNGITGAMLYTLNKEIWTY